MAEETAPGLPRLYKPLPPHSTRLIQICYEGKAKFPTTRLVTCAFKADKKNPGKLLPEVSYFAVSYCWGDLSQFHAWPIENEDGQQCTIDITKTLYNCLCNWGTYVRHSGEGDLFIWADQITINQKDLDEKASHIGQMRTIFQKARGVYVWLGDDPPGLFETLRKVSRVANTYVERWDELRACGRGSWQEYDLILNIAEGLLSDSPSADDKMMGDCFIHILNSPWFERGWILQEAAALPESNVMMHWASCSMSATPVATFAWVLQHTFEWQTSRVLNDSLAVRCYKAKGSDTLTRIKILRTLINAGANFHSPLWKCLVLLKNSQMTDSRDEVYCILPFASDVETNDPDLLVDYTVSYDVLLSRLVRWHLRTYQTLDFLSQRGYYRDQCDEDQTSPSWLPLATGEITGHFAHFEMYTLPGQRLMYSAGGSLSPTLLASVRHLADSRLDFLKCSALYLMEVKDMTFPDVADLRYAPYQPDKVYPISLLSFTDEYELFQGDRKAFWRFFVSDLEAKQRDVRPRGVDVNELVEDAQLAGQLLRGNSPFPEYCVRLSHSLHERASLESSTVLFTVTESERARYLYRQQEYSTSVFTCGPRGRSSPLWVGSCPALRLRENDEIWALRGGSLLAVLRRREMKRTRTGVCLDMAEGQHGEVKLAAGESAYGFVAMCYVHGLVDGQIFEMLGDNPSREPIEGMDKDFQNIFLV